LFVLSFVLVQCTKENTNEFKKSENTDINMRSNVSIGGYVISPNCNIYDELPDIECTTADTVTIAINSPNGCEVEVTMSVQNCFDRANDRIWFVFSDFEWHLAQPISNGCMNWYSGLILQEYGKQNELLDELETYLESEFERIYMTNEVINNNLTCKYTHTTSYQSILSVYVIPNTQTLT